MNDFEKQLAQTAPAADSAGSASQNVSQCPTAPDRLNGDSAQLDAGADTLADVLTDRQRAALELILAGQPDTAVARKLGIDRRTIFRWRHEHEPFAAELRQRRRQLWDGVVDKLRSLLDPAVDVLAEQLTQSYDRARYRAAVSILRLSNVRSAVPVGEEETR